MQMQTALNKKILLLYFFRDKTHTLNGAHRTG